MSNPTTKKEFISQLHEQMDILGISFDSDILSDFEQHFESGKEQGLTEEEICNNLGDIKEIALGFLPQGQEPITEKHHLHGKNTTAFVFLIIADVLLLFWLMFALGATVFGLCFTPLGLLITAIDLIFYSSVINNVLFLIFNLIMITGAIILSVIGVIYLVRLFIMLCKYYINWHLHLLGKEKLEVKL